MNYFKRLLSLVLALMLCLSALSGAVLADDETQAADNESVEETAEEILSEPVTENEVSQSETPETEVSGSLPDETEEAASETEEIISDTEEVLSETEETAENADEADTVGAEQAVASDEMELIADGVYGSVISSASDSRITTMLALIDNQNFTGSGITATQAKAYVNHFLFTSNFKAIGYGVYTYPNSGNYTYTVSDGTYTRSISGSKGCMSYCRFVSKVFYGREGSLRFSAIQTAASLKSMLQTYGQAGDHIRMGSRHSVTFISCDDNGFYCLSYQGDSTRYIYLEYWPYSTFVAYYSGSAIGIYDSNTAENSGSSGSESTQTGESTLSISGAVYPSGTITYGKSFSLGGTISSNYTLTNVTAYVRDANGTAKFSYSSNPAATSFVIAGSALDNSFKFASLAKGSYTYTVSATDSSGKTATLISSTFACGSPTTYSITYNANGGSGAPSSQTKNYNESITLSQTVPTYSGMKFIGWATSSAATAADYAAGAVYNENKSITLYAVWTQASGLRYENGRLYYVDDDNVKQTGLITVDGNTYYFDPTEDPDDSTAYGAAYISRWLKGTAVNYFGANGIMCVNCIREIDRSYYYFDEDGVLFTGGWFELNNCTYYAGADGKLASGITEIQNEKYYFNDSCALTVGFAKVGNDTYYFEESAEKDDAGQSNYAEMVYGWKTIGDKTYYFDDYGVMMTGWATFSAEEFDEDNSFTEENKYYFDDDGSLVTGWKWIDGYRYYFNKYNTAYDGAQYAIGMCMTCTIDFFCDPDSPSDLYYLDSEGRMLTGLQHVFGENYYFSENSDDIGILQYGPKWVNVSDRTYYIDEFGAALADCFRTIDGSTYYFASNGVMQTGWQYIDNGEGSDWYYFSDSGVMATGWQTLKPAESAGDDSSTEEYKYYFNADGSMVTGWKWIDGYRYYFNKYSTDSDGTQRAVGMCITSSVDFFYDPDDPGKIYYLDSEGRMLTGLQNVLGENYYFSESSDDIGTLQFGPKWVYTSGHWYHIDEYGIAEMMEEDGLITFNGELYYLGEDGEMAADTFLSIDGQEYYFGHTGKGMIAEFAELTCSKAYTADITAAEGSVFYTYTPTSSRNYVLYSTGADAEISLYSSDYELLKSDCGTAARVSYAMSAGQTYIFRIALNDTAATGSIGFRLGREYTVKYNANGGTGAPASQIKDYGRAMEISGSVPVREGYYFRGWSSSQTASAAAYRPGEEYTGNVNVTLYAVWDEILDGTSMSCNTSYTAQITEAGGKVYYDYTPTNGRTYVLYSKDGSPADVTLYDADGAILAHDSGENFRIAYAMTAGETYHFVVTAADVCDVTFTFGRVYTIKYSANGGTGAPAAQEKDYGHTMTITTAEPTRSGYIFLGWAGSSSAETAKYHPGDAYTSSGNTTLYAVWEEAKDVITALPLSCSGSYTAHFTAEGEKVYYDYTPTSDRTYVLCGAEGSAIVTLYGPDGTVLASGRGEHFRAAAALTAGQTYRFVITAVEAGDVSFTFGRVYTVKYKANGGTGAPETQEKDYGQRMTITTAEPTRSGYTFLGWSASKTATTVTYAAGGNYTANGNVTLYAVWQKN